MLPKNNDPIGSQDEASVVNFGCRLNAWEGDIMRNLSVRYGLKDCILVNSCAVTAEAERQVRQKIRRLRRQNPDKTIVVTGCAAQISPESFKAMDEVDYVIGNREKIDPKIIASLAAKTPERMIVSDITQAGIDAPSIPAFPSRARAFVEIQQGCDHRCTFCIIPYGRGPCRSLTIAKVVDQVGDLCRAGYQEVVLTGVDITDWGTDLDGNLRLGNLVQAILDALPQMNRLRLSSLDPSEIDPLLLDILSGEERMLPYIHLSVQSGDDMILTRMKRRHRRRDIMVLCDHIRRHREVSFGADFIAGFPTESEDMFNKSMDLMRYCRLSSAHVFPFSARPSTPAVRMPQVPGNIRKSRAARLRDLAARLYHREHTSRLGQKVPILVEDGGQGRCPRYAKILLNGQAHPGQVVQGTLKTIGHDGSLTADIESS